MIKKIITDHCQKHLLPGLKVILYHFLAIYQLDAYIYIKNKIFHIVSFLVDQRYNI